MSAYGDLAASGQIRLLKLDHMQPDSDLSGTLCVVNLDDLPKYYAISYMWGPPENSKQIIIHGVAYPIRKSLWGCLHALMQNFQHLHGSWIWADALCIRQDSVDEKSRQVAQIHEIFAGAERVYAWLGNDPLVEWTLGRIPTALQSHEEEPLGVPQGIRSHDYDRRSFHPVDTYSPVAFHPYFTRCWVVQECILARALTFVCGGASWEVGYNDQIPFGFKKRALNRLLHRRRSKSEGLWDHRLLKVIYDFRTTECDESRDMVYALQSLASPATRCPVDYRIEPVDLFWQVLLADSGPCDYHYIQNLRGCLGVSWADISSSLERVEYPHPQRPSLLPPYLGTSTCRSAVFGPGPEDGPIVIQEELFGRTFEGSSAFHLLYGTAQDDDMCVLLSFSCFVLVIVRTPRMDDGPPSVQGIALQNPARAYEKELRLLDEHWKLGFEYICQSPEVPKWDVGCNNAVVSVSPNVLYGLHKLGRYATGSYGQD